jgi:hypothetical protein
VRNIAEEVGRVKSHQHLAGARNESTT